MKEKIEIQFIRFIRFIHKFTQPWKKPLQKVSPTWLGYVMAIELFFKSIFYLCNQLQSYKYINIKIFNYRSSQNEISV